MAISPLKSGNFSGTYRPPSGARPSETASENDRGSDNPLVLIYFIFSQRLLKKNAEVKPIPDPDA